MKVIASLLAHMLAALLAEEEEQKELHESIELRETKEHQKALDNMSKKVA